MEVSNDAREIIFMAILGGGTAADRFYTIVLLDSDYIIYRLSVHTIC